VRPAAITTARLGSQLPLGMPKTSRKPKTLAGWISSLFDHPVGSSEQRRWNCQAFLQS
jgi:hypothetical protein